MSSREDEEEPTRDTDVGWPPPQRRLSREVLPAQRETHNPPTEREQRLYETPTDNLDLPESNLSDLPRTLRSPRAQRIQSRRNRVESWLDNVLEQAELEIHQDDVVLDSVSDIQRRPFHTTSFLTTPTMSIPGFTPLARTRFGVSAASGSQATSTRPVQVETNMPPPRVLLPTSGTTVRKATSDGEALHVKKKRSFTKLQTPTPSVASRLTATSSKASTTHRGSTTSSRTSTTHRGSTATSRTSTQRAPTATSSRASTLRAPTATFSRACASTISRSILKGKAIASPSAPGADIQLLYPIRQRLRPVATETVTSATAMDVSFEEPVKLETTKSSNIVTSYSSMTTMPSTSTLLPASQTASEDLRGGPRKLLVNQYYTPPSSCTSAVPSTSRVRPEPALAQNTRTFVKEISRVISIRNPHTNEIQEYWVRRNAQLLSEVGGSLQDTTHIVGTPSTVIIQKKPRAEKRKRNLRNINRIPSKAVSSSSSSGNRKQTPPPFDPSNPVPPQGPRFRRNRDLHMRRKRFRRSYDTDTSGYPVWEDMKSHSSNSSVSELYPIGSGSSTEMILPEISLKEKVESYLSHARKHNEDDDDD